MNRPHEDGYITIAGKTYQFKTPKVALILSAMIQAKGKSELEAVQIMLEAQVKTLRSGLGPEGWKDVATRLNDADDPIDWPDLQSALEEKLGQSANRPTTSSPASSEPQLATTTHEDEPKQEDSIFGI